MPLDIAERRRGFNATLGILGIAALSVFSVWFPYVVLNVPLPENVVARTAVDTSWQVLTGVIFPCFWAVRRLGMSLADLGVTRRGILPGTVLGLGLYSLALVAFVHCSGGQMMAEHTLRKVGLGEVFMLVPFMGLIAAGTDLFTRGFILLALARHAHVVFAIFMQNLVWFLAHIYEIELLTDCLGVAMAVGLTLALGVLGDFVALRTRNVLGLAIAHFLLNVILSVYLRYL